MTDNNVIMTSNREENRLRPHLVLTYTIYHYKTLVHLKEKLF